MYSKLPVLKSNTQAMLIRRQQLAIRNNARLMSTTTYRQQVRRGGINKGAVAAIFLAAAGFAYYQRAKEENKFYQGDSDPYEKTKKNVSQVGHDTAKEASKAGEQVKSSAESAGQATKDAYTNVKSSAEKEGKEAVENVKDGVDKFRSDHHLKEGDRSPESVLSNNYDKAASTAAAKYNQAKDTASDKYNQAKDTVAKDVNKAKDYFSSDNKEHRDNPNTQNKNPMVGEKVSKGNTKSEREKQMESHAENKVGDTTGLVNKDTNKVSPVWDNKNDQEKSGSNKPVIVDHEPKKKGFWGSVFGGGGDSSSSAAAEAYDKSHNAPVPAKPVDTSSKKNFPKANPASGNPMVNEKLTSDRTKSNQENHMEAYANDQVHDTSTLVGKDTEKVKGVWEDKAVRDQGLRGQDAPVQESPSSWSNLMNQAGEKIQQVEEKVENYIEEDVHKAASMWEGIKNKVGMASNDVKKDASDMYQDAKGKATTEASRLQRDARDTVNDASNKASRESGRLESRWENVKSQAKEEADAIYKSASDIVSSASSKLKEGTDQASSAIDQTRRDTGNLMQNQMDRASGNLNEMQKDADKLKSQTEQTAQSWYSKGTEQAKNSYDYVKDTVDEDIQWAGQKVQEGLASTKQEVDRLMGKQPKESNLTGHVIRGEKFAEEEEGQLKATRDNVGLKPAEVVVEHADGKEM